jgi:hypothetical protein
MCQQQQQLATQQALQCLAEASFLTVDLPNVSAMLPPKTPNFAFPQRNTSGNAVVAFAEKMSDCWNFSNLPSASSFLDFDEGTVVESSGPHDSREQNAQRVDAKHFFITVSKQRGKQSFEFRYQYSSEVVMLQGSELLEIVQKMLKIEQVPVFYHMSNSDNIDEIVLSENGIMSYLKEILDQRSFLSQYISFQDIRHPASIQEQLKRRGKELWSQRHEHLNTVQTMCNNLTQETQRLRSTSKSSTFSVDLRSFIT